MLVNLKNVPKTLPLLNNNNNNNGLNLPVTGVEKTKWYFYRFKPYPSKAIPNIKMYESTVSTVKLSPQCLHALHVFLHGLHYCITTHLEDVPRSASYRFISVVDGCYHIDCICHATGMEEDPKVTLDIQCLQRGGRVALT